MGVVIKQSFWGTVISYVGVVIGYANTLYFRSEYFSLEQIGLFTLVTAHAMTISPLSSLGTGSAYIKFFPAFGSDDKARFFSFLFVVAVLGNGLILLLGYFFQDLLAARYAEAAPGYLQFLFVTGIVIISNSLFDLFFCYSNCLFKVLFPSFIREVYLRLGSLALVIGFVWDWWDFSGAVVGLGVVYFGAFLLLFSKLYWTQGFHFDLRMGHINASWRKKIFRFSAYSMLLSGSFAIYNNASYDQITAYLGADAMGIFQTCFFIAVLVDMPRRNMAKVIGPIISTAFEKNDQVALKDIFKKSAITQSVVGSLLLVGIVTNLHDLFDFIPKGDAYRTGYWVVTLVCLAKISVMSAGFTGEIINFSHLYKYNLFFQMVAAAALLILNYWLIPIYGINGSGMAFLGATLIHVLIKLLFIKVHFGLSPFTRAHASLLLISLFCGALALLFAPQWHPVLSIAVRSLGTLIVFVCMVYYFQVSKDINLFVEGVFNRILKMKF